MPRDEDPLQVDDITEALLAQRLHAVMGDDALPPKVATIATLLDGYARATRARRRATIARALGLVVVEGPADDPDAMALHLLEAVQELPEFKPVAKAPASPYSAPDEVEGDNPRPAPADAPEGAFTGQDGERIVVNEHLRAKLDGGARVRVFGGVPVPKMLSWFRSALRADVVWTASDDMPRAPVFDLNTDAGVVLLQGLLGHNDMDKLTDAAKSACVPFARVNMPGRGELRRAVEILDRARVS